MAGNGGVVEGVEAVDRHFQDGIGEVIVMFREVVVLAPTALVFTIWSCDGGDVDQVAAHGAGDKYGQTLLHVMK
jgi:hypothetical protein